MAKTGAKKHIHKYYRDKNANVWACALPDCTHFMPHNVEYQVEGKMSICWNCHEPYVMNIGSMRDAIRGSGKPVCMECFTQGADIDDFINELAKKNRGDV